MARIQKNNPAVSPRMALENRYKISRGNLMIAVVFTLVNIILALVGGDIYFLFSASIPYYLVVYGMVLCGKMPAEFYEGDINDYIFLNDSFLIVMTVLSIVIVTLYALCWLFSSKQRSGWLIAALVLFAVDTIGMFLIYGFDLTMIIDILFHAWVIYYLVIGITACKKLKNLPEEEPEPIAEAPTESIPVEAPTESLPVEPVAETPAEDLPEAPEAEAAPTPEEKSVEQAPEGEPTQSTIPAPKE
jgi:hypothetical protein